MTKLLNLVLLFLVSTTALEGWQKAETRVTAGAVMGRTVGVNKSYGELAIFAPIDFGDAGVSFFDFRNYWFDRGYGSSVGVGYRFPVCDCTQLIGANVYYDFIQPNCVTFQRIGTGLEYISHCFDVRINGYFPIDSTIARTSTCFFDEMTRGYYAERREYLYSYIGFDAEVGAGINDFYSLDLYFATGPYYFHNRKWANFWGGMIRGAASWNDYLSFECKLTYDKHFQTRAQGKVLFEIPFSCIWDLCNWWGNTRCVEACSYPCFEQTQRSGLIGLGRQCCWYWNW